MITLEKCITEYLKQMMKDDPEVGASKAQKDAQFKHARYECKKLVPVYEDIYTIETNTKNLEGEVTKLAGSHTNLANAVKVQGETLQHLAEDLNG